MQKISGTGKPFLSISRKIFDFRIPEIDSGALLSTRPSPSLRKFTGVVCVQRRRRPAPWSCQRFYNSYIAGAPWWLLEPADPTLILGLDEPADPTGILGLDEPADPTGILGLDESADPTGILGLVVPADPTGILGLEPADLTGILGELRGQERRQPPIVQLVHWRD